MLPPQLSFQNRISRGGEWLEMRSDKVKINTHDSKVQPGLSSIIIPLFNSSSSNRITIRSPPLPLPPPHPPFSHKTSQYIYDQPQNDMIAKGILGLLIFPPENPSPGITRMHHHTSKAFLLLVKNKQNHQGRVMAQGHLAMKRCNGSEAQGI